MTLTQEEQNFERRMKTSFDLFLFQHKFMWNVIAFSGGKMPTKSFYRSLTEAPETLLDFSFSCFLLIFIGFFFVPS